MAKHILVVDDDTLLRRSLGLQLDQAGYRTSTAASAEDALGLARRDQPDLILLDVGLPGMDGLEATKILKGDPQTESIPILAATSHAMKGDQEKAHAAGCDGYITKPIDTRALADEVGKFLPPGPGE